MTIRKAKIKWIDIEILAKVTSVFCVRDIDIFGNTSSPYTKNPPKAIGRYKMIITKRKIIIIIIIQHYFSIIIPEKAIVTLTENLSLLTISFCIVGNVEAPPKANSKVPKARKKSWKSCLRCFGVLVKAIPSLTICVRNRTQAMAVVSRAMTPTNLNWFFKCYWREEVNLNSNRVDVAYRKSLGDPNHIKGIRITAIAINQKQKLMFGKNVVRSSCRIWEASKR